MGGDEDDPRLTGSTQTEDKGIGSSHSTYPELELRFKRPSEGELPLNPPPTPQLGQTSFNFLSVP